MPEKRPYPGDQGDVNGTKRPKPTAPANVKDALAAAKAKAAAAAEKIKARTAGASASPAPPLASPSAPASAAADRLAAMKARMAALKNGSAGASPSSTNAPPVRPAASASAREEDMPRQVDNRNPRFATTLGNRRAESPLSTAKTGKVTPKQPEEEEERENPYFDPKAVGATRGRVKRGLLFNQHGKYTEQASKLRQQVNLEKIKALLADRNRKAKLDENSERGFLVQAPPDVEWWDEGLLEEKTYEHLDDPSKVKLDSEDSIITAYVQHPVLLKAPQDGLLVQIKPMYLTQKEQAKRRRMRRAEEHKETQAKIRLGLEPPPPPKVKRGNMMRVMGEQAIADPTAVEMLVEGQIAERHDNHVKANEERKLTKEERNTKLTENIQKDAQKGLHMCVFKIDSLAYGKHRYQIDLNAKQHSLTGLTIFNPTLNLVIVEGGFHSIEKYKRLMLNRIKWTENNIPTEIQMEKQATDPQWMKSLDDQGHLKDLSYNKCTLVFEGEVRQRAFRKWGSKMAESDGEAKEVLARSKLDSLWGLAKSTE